MTMMKETELSDVADDLVHYIHAKYPHMELYELGALLISSGCFLTASAIPDLWPRLKAPASLAHELLLNEQTKVKLNVKAE